MPTSLLKQKMTEQAALSLPAGWTTTEAAVEILATALGYDGTSSTVDAVPVVNRADRISTSFTRPADTTAYAIGDLVANSTTAGSVTPISFTAARLVGGSGYIRRVKLESTSTSLTNGVYRLELYNTLPTVTNGDNGAWLSPKSGHLGSVDITMSRVFSDGSTGIGTPSNGFDILFTTAASSQVIYGLLTVQAARTPISGEVFTLVAEILQN